MKHFTANVSLLPGLLLAGLSLAACDDSDDYASHPPYFSDITFSPDTVRAGETFVATAVQSSAGTLLDRTTYTWTLSQNGEEVDVAHRYTTGGVYPYLPSNPTDTLTIGTAGSYVLTLVARYNISGQSDGTYYYVSSDDGSFSASCQGGSWNYTITMTKTFRVE